MTTKEKPIIFSGPSIPAIQNLKPNTWPPEPIDPGKPWKCMTRRIIKAPVLSKVRQPDEVIFDGNVCEFAWHGNDVVGGFKIKCPYPPGTRLYVKETWAPFYWTEDYISVCYAADGIDKETAGSRRVLLKNPGIAKEQVRVDGGFGNIKTWRSSRFMPKWAARLFLEVKSARAERLWDITDEDARAEGCYCTYEAAIPFQRLAGQSFEAVWDTLYARRGHPWRDNDWVFVYSFGRIDNYGKN